MNISFQGKVALVTGTAMGMGLATAKAFAGAGAAVVLADTNEEALRDAVDTLKAAGHKAIGVRCDVANETDVDAMVEKKCPLSADLMPRTTTPASRRRPRTRPMRAARTSNG